MGGGKDSEAGQEFATTQDEWSSKHGVKFAMALSDLPAPTAPRLALISGRTADNPRLLTESIANGVKWCVVCFVCRDQSIDRFFCSSLEDTHSLTHSLHPTTHYYSIYLEKPGAPTVAELEQMQTEAAAAGVDVLMGYNKNVCKYVRKTREFASSVEGSHVTFVSNNAYENTKESLGECFERNAEGMLKNMAIHELALLVSFYDVSVDNIASVKADKEFSSLQTLPGPSGKEFTDFDKIKFTITTKTGKEVSVAADRCGGTDSYATVSDTSGAEIFRYYMPDEEDKSHVKALQAQYPTAMPYFFTQDPDYITVKERVAKHTVDGKGAEGVATIGVAVETLKVAEYLTPLLQEQLK